jgi:twinkle protein
MNESKRLRDLANEIAAKHSKIIRDARSVDVGKYAIPEDSHLLRSPMAFVDDVLAEFADTEPKGDTMPAGKTHELMRFRPGEVSLWVGYKESYKTTFISEMVTRWSCVGVKCAVSSLEMAAAVLLAKQVRQALARATPSPSQVLRALEAMSESLTIYDVTGRVAPRHLISIMRYCALELGVRHFVLDNLTMILSADNDRAAEHQAFVGDAMTVAKTTGMHIHLVAHCYKPEGGDENRIPSGYNARGTGTAPDMVDNILVVWRNKKKEDARDAEKITDEQREQPDMLVKVDKQRHARYRGRLNFWFAGDTLRFNPSGIEDPEPFL